MPPLRIDMFVGPDGSVTDLDLSQILIGMDVEFADLDKWVKKGAASGDWVEKQSVIGQVRIFENYNGYAVEDPNSRFTISGNGEKITIDSITRSEVAYVVKDYGAGFLADDFEITGEVFVEDTLSSGSFYIMGLSKNLGHAVTGATYLADSLLIQVFSSTFTSQVQIILREVDSLGVLSASFGSSFLALDTPYYLKLRRVLSEGTYGTVYLGIYSDSAKTVLVQELPIVLNASMAGFKYQYGVQSLDGDSASLNLSGYLNQVNIQGLSRDIWTEKQNVNSTWNKKQDA